MPPPEALRGMIHEAIHDAVGRSGGASSSGDGGGGGADSALIRFTSPKPFGRVPAQMISVPKAALQNAVDAIGRSMHATEHARKMMANGATVFEQERDTLKSALELLKEQLDAVGN